MCRVEGFRLSGLSPDQERRRECVRRGRRVVRKYRRISLRREMRRLKDVQVKAGLELTKMEEKLDSLLHTEDYTVGEVVEILGIDTEYLKTNILTANTQEVQKFRLYQRAKHVYSEAARVYKFR